MSSFKKSCPRQSWGWKGITGKALLGLLLAPASLWGAEGDPIIFTPPADTPAGGPGFAGVLDVTNNGTINTQDDARVSLKSGTGTRVPSTTTVINYGPNDGHYTSNNLSFANPGNNISWVAQGAIAIPTAGRYTFGVNSDDGFTLAFPGRAFASNNGGNGANLQTYNGVANGALQFYGGRGNNDSFAQIDLPAGNIPFNLTFHQGAGGFGLEFFAAAGDKSSFDSSFALVGQQASTVTKRLVGVGTWNYKEFQHGNASVNSISGAVAAYNNGNPTVPLANQSTPTTINYSSSGGASHGDAVPFPGDGNNGTNDNFGAGARVPFTVSAADAGKFTFDILSDDGHQFRVLDAAGNPITNSLTHTFGIDAGLADGSGFSNNGCCSDGGGTFNLPAGNYQLEAIFAQGGGGASFEVYGAQGDYGGFDPSIFQLVGQNQSTVNTVPAGLQFAATPEPASLGVLALGGGALLARRRRKA